MRRTKQCKENNLLVYGNTTNNIQMPFFKNLKVICNFFPDKKQTVKILILKYIGSQFLTHGKRIIEIRYNSGMYRYYIQAYQGLQIQFLLD